MINNNLVKCFGCHLVKAQHNSNSFSQCVNCNIELCSECFLRLFFIESIHNKNNLGKELTVKINCPQCESSKIENEKKVLLESPLREKNKQICILHEEEDVQFCINCQIWLCAKCKEEFHNKTYSEHTLSLAYRYPCKCHYHMTKNLTLFCDDCKVCICYNCYDNKHYGHHCYTKSQLEGIFLIKNKTIQNSFRFKTIDTLANYINEIGNDSIKEMSFPLVKENFDFITKCFRIYYSDVEEYNYNSLSLQPLINLFRVTIESDINNYRVKIETEEINNDDLLIQPTSLYTPSTQFKITSKIKAFDNYVLNMTQLKDGRIAAYSTKNNIKIYYKDDKHISLRGHSKRIICILPLKDGRLASSSEDVSIKVWDVIKAKCIFTLKGHSQKCHCLMQLKDGRLVSSSDDNTIKIWNLATGKAEITLTEHQSSVRSVLELQNFNLASYSSDNKLIFWKVESAKKITKLECKEYDNVLSIIQLDNGNILLGAVESIKILDINDFTCIYSRACTHPRNICQLIDGRIAYLDKSTKSIPKNENIPDLNGQIEQLVKVYHDKVNTRNYIIKKYDKITIIDLDNKTEAAITLENNDNLISSFIQMSNGSIVTGGFKSINIWN